MAGLAGTPSAGSTADRPTDTTSKLPDRTGTERSAGSTADERPSDAAGNRPDDAAGNRPDDLAGNRPDRQAGRGEAWSLGHAAGVFWSKRSPWVIGAYLVVALGVRIAMGRWGLFDLVIPVAVLLAEPFTEWAIHVVILHWRPRRIGGRTIDLHAGREHRRHHADPRDLDIVFVPIRLVLVDIPVLMAIGLIIMPTVRLGLTLAATAMAMLLTYEWTHFLIHSPYRPRHAPYRYLWRAHRLHHYRNEHYWFGVTMPFGDHVLGTFPERGAVELSPTARSLGLGELARAAGDQS